MSLAPSCPRCGYDQSGAIAAWERNDPPCCPLRGTCTECGLGFAWRDLLNDVYALELRMFEHALSRVPRSFVHTLWRAQRGWSFWRWIRIENPVVPRRLGLMSILGLPAAYLAAGLGLALVAGVHFSLSWLFQWYTKTPMWVAGFDDPGVLLGRALWPLGDWPVGWSWVSPLALMAVMAFLIMPVTFKLLPQTLRKAKVRRVHVLRVFVYGLVALPVIFALPRIVLGVLTLTRFWGAANRILWQVSQFEWWIEFVLVTSWLVAWWSWASGRYLRLPRPWAIGLAMATMSLLAAMVLVVLVGDPNWFFDSV